MDYADAISGIESGGRYNLLGPLTRGDRAHGKYQVMGANIGPWTKEHYGQSLTSDQFLNSPEAQEVVFKGQFGKYVDKYGPEGAARAWFAGEGGMNNPNARDVLGTSVSGYADKFNRALGYAGDAPSAEAGPISAALDKGKQQMADPTQPALSPQSFTGGLGALFGSPDFKQSLRESAGWLMAPENPAVLGEVLKPHEDFSLVQGSDGSMYRLNKKTGQVMPYAVQPRDEFSLTQGSDGSIYRLNKKTGDVSPYNVQPRDDYSVVSGADGTMYRLNKKTGQLEPATGSQGKIVTIGTDIAGNPQHGFQLGNELYDLSGNRIGGIGPGQQGGGPNNGAVTPNAAFQDPFLAKGVTKESFNHDQTDPEKYIAQYAPEIQDWIKAKAEGRVPAAANMRKGFTNVSEPAAARYGTLTGIPMDEASVKGRQKMGSEIGSNQIGTTGGQITSGATAMGHLASLIDSYKPLHNLASLGTPFGAQISGMGNAIKNAVVPSYKEAADALDTYNRKYGAEITRYISGARGTGHERETAAQFTPNLTIGQVKQRADAELALTDEKTDKLLKSAERELGSNNKRVIELRNTLAEARQKAQAAIDSLGAAPAAPVKPTAPALPKGVKSITLE